ncbi:MAG TPA: CorA family divalent cation transporter [Candidatus Limnocylindria bacterium]|nr:CorA family divalent cation transporter [Candidatus Limnocylindria bacterium]
MANEATRADDPADGAENCVRIRLFDADRTDRSLSFDDALRSKVSARQIMWIDVGGNLTDEQRERLVERFELVEATDHALAKPNGRPGVQLHGRHFVLHLAAELDPEDPRRVGWLDIVAGPNVVITQHESPIEALGSMDRRIAEDATIGVADSAEFVAALGEAIVTGYYAAIDRIEDELDDFDAKALQRRQPDDLFGRLVEIRRRIARLRRVLAAHRELFGAIGSPDFASGIESTDPQVFVPLAGRFEGVLTSLESTREVVLGSFDILMTRTGQRTNDIMRVLTVATVLAIPAAVTAGFLGMNVLVPLPADDPGAFWLVLGVVAVIEVGLLAIARWRGWI